MEFVVFVWLCAGLIALFYAAACALMGFFPVKRAHSGYLAGLGLLLALLCLYLPFYENLWNEAAKGLGSPLFQGVWQIAFVFGPVWPAFAAALLGMAFGEAAHPSSGGYRATKGFHHTKIVLMCLLLGAYGLLHFFQKGVLLQTVLLNAALYTACWYWRFGFNTIAFTLQKCGVPPFIGPALLTAASIFSGAAFILPLIMVTGIGISDIWMDYHRRGAARLLFTLQLK